MFLDFLVGRVTFSQACSNENYTQEIQQLKRQLEIATEERNELEVSIYFIILTSCSWILLNFKCIFWLSNCINTVNCHGKYYLFLASFYSQK
jgi:hypothetical protein